MIKYIALNYFRKYTRLINKNKMKFVFGFLLSLILVVISIDLVNLIEYKNTEVIYLLIFAYSIAKLFQDIPVINLPYQLIQFKVLELWKVKLLMMLKCVYPSYIILGIIYLFPTLLSQLEFSRMLVLVMINISANIVCFFISQSKNKNILKIMTVLYLSFAYYFNSIFIIGVFILINTIKFINIKYIDYDLLLPYSHAMSNISEGLLNGDIEGIVNSQQLLIKSKSSSKLNLLEKYYDNPIQFLFFKEILRALYHENRLINISVTNFIIGLATSMIGVNSKVIYVISFIIVIYICDNFLSTLNDTEVMNRNKGFYFPYKTKEILNQKYIPHLCILAVPFISSTFLLNGINSASFIICYLLIPIKNILKSFSYKKENQYTIKVLSITIILSCLYNLI